MALFQNTNTPSAMFETQNTFFNIAKCIAYMNVDIDMCIAYIRDSNDHTVVHINDIIRLSKEQVAGKSYPETCSLLVYL